MSTIALTHPTGGTATGSAQCSRSRYADVTPYLTTLMLRDFATRTWRFRSDGRVSLPGCIIASPSRPDDLYTDQDYMHS